MENGQWEIIVLKPTSAFISFLSSQLPELELPELPLLQTDTTAYVIHKQECEEATVDEIERHFHYMFKHEISRRLGVSASQKVQGTFLDFLCCFKFELHSHIVLMEPSMAAGRQLLRVHPRSVLLKWIKTFNEEQEEFTSVVERVSLSHFVENSTVVVKNFKQLSDVDTLIHQCYPLLFKEEMLRMREKKEQWPVMETFQQFNRYFSVAAHTQLIHLYE